MSGLDVPTLAYLAAVIDTRGIIRTRAVAGGELPMVAVHDGNEPMLRLLGELTGTKVTIVRRAYSKAGCAQHCKEKHQHVQSVSGRWSVCGAKATVLLHNLRPYLRFQQGQAADAIAVGTAAPFKPATVDKMRALGWDVPDFGQESAA